MATPITKKNTKGGRKPSAPGPYDIAPPGETDEQKTIRLAKRREYKLIQLTNKRMPKALNAIRMIANLRAYKPTEADIDAITQALVDAVQAVDGLLRSTGKVKAGFSLRTHSG